MRLLLVHTHSIDTLGGAELSLKSHVETAPKDVSIHVVRPDDPVDLSAYETVILSNLRPEGGLGEEAEYGPALEWIRRLRGYRGYVIRLEHDVHPCTHRDAHCIDFHALDEWNCSCRSPIPYWYEKLYNLCDTIIFLSPLHRQAINRIIRIRGPRQVDIATPVDFESFRSITPFAERKHAAMVTGDSVRVAPEAEALAAAKGYPVEFVEYLSVPYKDMPDFLNQYQAVVVAPRMLHAFGRLAIEAMACGCEVITNERVGAMSWPDPLAACRKSDEVFWELVGQRPKAPNPRRRLWGWFFRRMK